MIEGIQGEGGVNIATPEYLLGLRQLCDEKKMLLLWDGVQCGHFRTGCFQSYQRILEGVPEGGRFLPDGISMAKSLGGGFPIGAFWVREPHADLLGPGTHGSTYGGSPLACAVALKVLEVIRRQNLAANAREMGEVLRTGLQQLAQKYPDVIGGARGLGLLVGFDLAPGIPAFQGAGKPAASRFINLLHDAGLLAVPAGSQTIRLLPALNLRREEAEEGLRIIGSVAAHLAG
jgi:acetylornithine aminotransferase/acetylornithine/N-succinyldiaminopimelate aminotransferase